MINHKTFLGAGVFALLAFTLPNAAATEWTIDKVLSGVDGGYGYSSFHEVIGTTSPMSGGLLANIAEGVTGGTYDDVTGAFSATFTATDVYDDSADITFSLTSHNVACGGGSPCNPVFTGGDEHLDGPFGQLNAAFSGGGVAQLGDYELFFAPGAGLCCGAAGDDAPNSFVVSGDSAVMTLWGWTRMQGNLTYIGAKGDGIACAGGSTPGLDCLSDARTGGDYGIDLRLELSTVSVPAPPVVYLLGLGLLVIGLGKSRKNRITQ